MIARGSGDRSAALSRSPDRAAIERGRDLEHDVMAALGCLSGVTVNRNPKGKTRLPSGATVTLGIAGDGAPDLHVEVRTPSGLTACVWLECKSGDFARLNKDQRAWFAAARHEARHAFVVRSVEHAREVVGAFMRGEVPCE